MKLIKIKKSQKGFTLIEILLVIVLIGIFLTIGLVSLNIEAKLIDARNDTRQSDIKKIEGALIQYRLQEGNYPTGLSRDYKEICDPEATDCTDFFDLKQFLVPTYLQAIPQDPNDIGSTEGAGYEVAIDSATNIVSVRLKESLRESGEIIAINVPLPAEPTVTANTTLDAVVPPPPIITSGLVLNLDAGNPASYPGTGTTWTDLSGNGNNGTLINGVGYNSANGGSLTFNGTNHYVQTPLVGVYPQISFEFWGFFDDPTLSTTSRNESAFGDWISNRIHFGTRWSVGQHWNVNGVWINIANTNLRYGWNHYSLVWSGTNNIKRVYINGILSSSETVSGNINITLGDFKIGVATNLNAFYRGNIANFRVYNRALTQEETQQNYNALRGRYGL